MESLDGGYMTTCSPLAKICMVILSTSYEGNSVGLLGKRTVHTNTSFIGMSIINNATVYLKNILFCIFYDYNDVNIHIFKLRGRKLLKSVGLHTFIENFH